MADYVVKLNGQDNLSPTLNSVKSALNEVGSASKGVDKIKERFDKIQNSTAPLRKKLADTKKQMEELAATGDTSSDTFKAMADAAKRYQETLNKVNSAIKDVDTSSKGMNKSVGGGFDMSNLKGAAKGFTDQMNLGGLEKIGPALANPYVLAGAAIAGAGKALYDYNVELERSLQKTAQFTGLSGDALMSLRNGIKSVADTFDKDYDTVLASVDNLMSQFGIDGEEALQIIRDGFVGGADDGGKMLDLISKFGGAFNDAGISASELVAIIGNTRSGIFSEEGMDLFAKGATKIREFSKGLQDSLTAVGINADEMYAKLQSGEMTTVQALQSISAKLKDLSPQSQEVGEVMKNVFGKQGAQAGYELVTALADVETNLDIVKEQTGEWGKAMEDLQRADREFENALSSLFGVAEGGFSTMTTKLKAEVYGAVAKVINGFIDWYNKSLVVRAGVASLATGFKNAWEIIKTILKLFMNSVQSLGELIEGVLTLDWNKVKNSWKNGMSNILTTIATGFENIKDNIADGIEQTVNGQIKKIEVPVDVTYSTNNGGVGKNGRGSSSGGHSNGGSGKGSKGSSGSSSSKIEKVKSDAKLKEELYNTLKKQVTDAVRQFNIGAITKEELINVLKNTNAGFAENGFKEKIGLDFSFENGFEKAKTKLIGEIGDLSLSLPKIEIQTDLKPLPDTSQTKTDLSGIADGASKAAGAFGNLAGSIGQVTEDEGLAKSALIAQAIGQLALSFAGAMKGTFTPWDWIAGAISGAAVLTSLVASLSSFADGGIVAGGSMHGDHMLARVNSGEMILNGRQQNNLFNAIDNNRFGSNGGGKVEFVIDGRVIKGVLKNYDSKIGKIK